MMLLPVAILALILFWVVFFATRPKKNMQSIPRGGFASWLEEYHKENNPNQDFSEFWKEYHNE